MNETSHALRAGAVRVDITPNVPTPLAGYPEIKLIEGGPRDHLGYVGRTGLATGSHDPLYARALALADASTTVVLVSLDLCMVTASFTRAVRRRAAQRARIREDAILLAASHTHSGPDLFGHWEPEVPGAQEEVCERVVAAIEGAVAGLRPAALGWGHGHLPQPVVNRRDPSHPIDPEVGLLRVDAVDGEPIARAIVYACHPIIVGTQNRQFSADYVGYATSVVERAYDEQAVCLFLNGPAGNINPAAFPYAPDRNMSALTKQLTLAGQAVSFRSFAEARRMGNLLGGEALRAGELVQLAPKAALAVEGGTVTVPLKTASDLERYFEHLALQDHVRRDLRARASVDLELQAVRIGDAVLVGVPGEPFVELGLDLKRARSGLPTYMLGYANGYIGYIPNSAGFQQNRYESVATPLSSESPLLVSAEAARLLAVVTA